MPHAQVSLQRSPTPRDSLRMRKDANERLELIADIWEQVRAEVLQERLEQLSQKVLLQRELISAQDRRAHLIRRQQEDTRLKKRNEEKKKKQNILASLQDKCRQSLALDRMTKTKSHTSNICEQSREKQAVQRENEDTSEKNTPISRRAPSSCSNSQTEILVSSSTQEIENEDDISKNEQAASRKVEEMPATRQHSELFKLYGHNASKYTDGGKLIRKKIPHASLKKLSGHMSASQIWTSLWSDSVSKLLQAEQKFPKDLKETFSAHVRQGITKFQKPVSRSFTLTEDVPNLDSLRDKSKLHRVRVLHHKTQLMYRSSLVNQDRTKILLFNNPLPSLSDQEQGISRFLPPCDDTDSVSTEASYLRWLKEDQYSERGDHRENSTCAGRKMPPSLLYGGSGASQDLQDIWDSVLTRRKPKKEPRYHFLTEKEAWSPGAFRARFNLGKGPGYPDMVSHQGNSKSGGEPARLLSATERSQFESSWEPLSMHALREYKQQLSADGHGEFQQGRATMWKKLPS